MLTMSIASSYGFNSGFLSSIAQNELERKTSISSELSFFGHYSTNRTDVNRVLSQMVEDGVIGEQEVLDCRCEYPKLTTKRLLTKVISKAKPALGVAKELSDMEVKLCGNGAVAEALPFNYRIVLRSGVPSPVHELVDYLCVYLARNGLMVDAVELIESDMSYNIMVEVFDSIANTKPKDVEQYFFESMAEYLGFEEESVSDVISSLVEELDLDFDSHVYGSPDSVIKKTFFDCASAFFNNLIKARRKYNDIELKELDDVLLYFKSLNYGSYQSFAEELISLMSKIYSLDIKLLDCGGECYPVNHIALSVTELAHVAGYEKSVDRVIEYIWETGEGAGLVIPFVEDADDFKNSFNKVTNSLEEFTRIVEGANQHYDDLTR